MRVLEAEVSAVLLSNCLLRRCFGDSYGFLCCLFSAGDLLLEKSSQKTSISDSVKFTQQVFSCYLNVLIKIFLIDLSEPSLLLQVTINLFPQLLLTYRTYTHIAKGTQIHIWDQQLRPFYWYFIVQVKHKM